MHLVYFGQTPSQGTGSPITMLRHLRRFAQSGARISVVAEWGDPAEACVTEGWEVRHLPHRKAWWPPFSGGGGWTRAVRMRLWARECGSMLGRPTAIVTYLGIHSELLSEIAAHYARASGVPLSVIVHDDVRAFHRGSAEELDERLRRYRWVLSQARQKWFATRELGEAYGQPVTEADVLLPIPEGTDLRVEWRDEFATRPVVVYAGYLYEQQWPLIARIARVVDRAGGELVVLTRETPPLTEFCVRERITLHGLLPTNADALAFVAQRAAGFLAAYCDDSKEMPWVRTSFPSKVVEFSHLGLPVLFVAPAESAIYRWNAQRNVPCNLLPSDEAGVANFISALRQRDSWEHLAHSTRALADTEFSPGTIQRRMARRLV